MLAGCCREKWSVDALGQNSHLTGFRREADVAIAVAEVAAGWFADFWPNGESADTFSGPKCRARNPLFEPLLWVVDHAFIKSRVRASSHVSACKNVEPIAIQEQALSRGDEDKRRDTSLDPSASAHEFRQGLARHQQGRLVEAERHYNAALKGQPDNFDALHMLGVIALQKGRFEQGVEIVTKAVALNENSAIAFNNLAKGLKDLGRFDEAIVHFERAIALAPAFADAQFNYGTALHFVNRSEDALVHFEEAIALQPKFVAALNNRGLALAKLKRFTEALASYDQALSIQPSFGDAHNNRGNALKALMRFDDALASFDKAIAARPDSAEAHCNRGNVLVQLERFDDALASFDTAIAIRPRFAEAHRGRGDALANLNRFGDALGSFDRAIAIEPLYVDARISRTETLFTCNRNDEAVKSAQAAIDIDPENALCRFLACVCELRILYANEDDVEARRRAYENKLRAICSDYETGRLRANMIEAVAHCKPFYLAYQGHNDRDLQTRYGTLAGRAIGARFPQAALPPPPEAGEPIRVGFVSSHFYAHSNWKIPIKGWMSHLDRNRFTIFGYHLGRHRDQETEVAAKLCSRFVDRALRLEGWRDEILADAPHVLIYPGLLMDELSLQLAAQRLAPVQCNSLGHPETGGLPTLDYFLSSDLMEPPDAAKHYTERLVRLPNLSIYYEPLTTSRATIPRGELGVKPNAIVFWCGQSLYKYHPQYDFVFARIAKFAGNCQFVFIKHAKEAAVADLFHRRLDSAFSQWGLTASDHCLFIESLTTDRYIAAMGACDIFLDSIGWSGFNSTSESLVHNLPVVTLRGALMRGRHSTAILNRIGVGETVADSIDEYVSIATRLATSSAERRRISVEIDRNKHRVYRDRDCIAGLEDFIENAARGHMVERD
jgi:protein O-GlcNAc transferase